VVEVRARPGHTLFSEIVGPPAPAESLGDAADPLAHLRPFCAGALLHDGPDGRAVRVLTTV
jgi:hypothetical protein